MEKTKITHVLANYHTHSSYCDGNATLEEMAEAAYKSGLKYFGFSSHSAFPATTGCEMHPKNFLSYKSEIEALKIKYADKMEILFGFEADYLPPLSWPDYSYYKDFSPDYLIGSVHFVWNHDVPENGTMTVDDETEKVKKGLENIFFGNGKKMVQTYFDHQRQMIKTCDFDIIGHIDLVRKRNAILKIYDETDSWYKKELKATAIEIAKAGLVVEINTGGMARGAISSPYPSLEFLKILNKLDVPIIFSSDAHSPEHIVYGFEEAANLAKNAGYSERQYLTSNGFESTKI